MNCPWSYATQATTNRSFLNWHLFWMVKPSSRSFSKYWPPATTNNIRHMFASDATCSATNCLVGLHQLEISCIQSIVKFDLSLPGFLLANVLMTNTSWKMSCITFLQNIRLLSIMSSFSKGDHTIRNLRPHWKTYSWWFPSLSWCLTRHPTQ